MKAIIFTGLVCCAMGVLAADWFIDSAAGNDALAGTNAATAWKSLDAHNKASGIAPGDRVLFKCGGLWRGSLVAKSGEPGSPVLYTSYGTGPKPILQNSVDQSRESDWEELKPGVWATKKYVPQVHEQVWDGRDCQRWRGSFQEGVKGTVKVLEENGERFVRVMCTEQSKRAGNLIQVWGPSVDNLPERALLRMKMRASKSMSFDQIGLSLNRAPWTCGHRGSALADGSAVEIGPDWKIVEVRLVKVNSIGKGHFHFRLGDVMPLGGTLDFIPLGIWRMKVDARERLPFDVGIFICNHGEKWGVKKWSPEALENPLDYWDDRANGRVMVRWDGNPAKSFKSIELALTRSVIVESSCHDVVYDGLAVRYGGAHGFGGGPTRNIVIRNCDIYWIGGGLQHWSVNSKGVRTPARFGNGIEFWGECHSNLVERNRLWQIYDAALTNQTRNDPRTETDVIWRDNVIWQAEYSFEYWNHDPRSFTGSILFEHNTCVDAGYGWGHGQRPNPNGAHLMFFDNAAPTTNFIVRNNLFVRTTDRAMRMFNDWRAKAGSSEGLTIDHNLYFIPENAIYEYHVNGRERKTKPGIRLSPAKYGAGVEEFKKYQSEMEMDVGSVYGEPQFINESQRDYRLKPGTFGCDLATDGGPLGARDMPGLAEVAFCTSSHADVKKIICWGDSITEGMAMARQDAYPARLQALLGNGFKVLNSGDGGEDAITIPARQGCLALQTSARLEFDEGVRRILLGDETDNGFRTADGGKITLTLALGREVPVNPIVIGDDTYRLSITDFKWNTAERPITYKLWLERDDDREPVAIPIGQSFSFASAEAALDAFCEVILMGANGGWQNKIENLIDRYKTMISRRGTEKPFIVIVPFWGGITAEQVQAFKAAFGEHAVDFRRESIQHGLVTEGLVATELDRREMAAGRVPPSLLYENRPNCHLNAKGYDLLARLVFERGKTLGYWTDNREMAE